jgi:hypothetical protein
MIIYCTNLPFGSSVVENHQARSSRVSTSLETNGEGAQA